jgi:hypothetical protein
VQVATVKGQFLQVHIGLIFGAAIALIFCPGLAQNNQLGVVSSSPSAEITKFSHYLINHT